jgi:hypothetical protein
MCILKILFKAVTASIEVLVSWNKIFYACATEVCRLGAQSHFIL